MNEQEAIQDFLGGRPESSQLTEWRDVLERRLQAMQAERDRSPSPALDQKIAQLKKQVAALKEEEAITQFVEDSVRVTLHMGSQAEEPEAGEW